MPITLEQIYRFPIKGLHGERLESVELKSGAGMPNDRRFGFARGDTKLREESPRWRPKQRFIMLMRDTDLAPLACRLDTTSSEIELLAPGRPPCRARFDTDGGRTALSRYANEILGPRREGDACWTEAGESSFTDVPQNCFSLVNLESVRDFEQKIGTAVDPMRFRANLYIDGVPPWSEFDWIGKQIQIGGVTFAVPARIPRCAAPSVNPETGKRDINVLKELRKAYGHFDMGIYGEVVVGGRIGTRDTVIPPEDAQTRSRLSHWVRFLTFLARSAPIVLRRR